jgi:hypothetical protein
MSLVPLVLRILTVKALRGQTYAGARVLDSSMDTLDLTVAQGNSPVIVVYSDDEEYSREHGKHAMLAGNRTVDLVIESAVASKVEAQDGTAQVVIPHTDAGMEAVLGLMGRQIVRGLLASGTPWSELWRRCVVNVPKVMIRRGAASEQGVRFAARQMVISCQTLHEPDFGSPVEAGLFWADVLAAMAADTDLASLAGVLRQEIENPALTPFERVAAELGISKAEVSMLGIGDGAAPLLAGVVLDGVEYDANAVQEAVGS